jgi:hypothetical protein
MRNYLALLILLDSRSAARDSCARSPTVWRNSSSTLDPNGAVLFGMQMLISPGTGSGGARPAHRHRRAVPWARPCRSGIECAGCVKKWQRRAAPRRSGGGRGVESLPPS